MQSTGRITALLLLATFAVACSDESLPFAPTTDAEPPELAVAMNAAAAQSANVGYYRITFGAGQPNMVAAITTGGHTPVLLNDVTAADLAGLDVLFIDNPSNFSYAGGGGEFAAALADIAAWVNAGGVMVFHDRYVDPAETVLPGGATFNIIRDFNDPFNIDVRDNSTVVTNGPGGIIDNTTLDGGNFSSHGFAVAGSLPGNGAFILSRTDPDELVTFSYCYGVGGVVYSSIPLDFYLAGFGPPAVSANFRDIYAPNVVHYGAEGFCTIFVDIDIKPGSDPNSINTKSKGVIPVAILTTAVADGDASDFDGTTVDPLSVTFGPGASTEKHGKGHLEDVDGDGDTDLVLHFPTEDSGLAVGDTEACLQGETFGGQPIQGCDAVNIVK